MKKIKFFLMSIFLLIVTSGIICASAAAWYVFIYLDPQLDIDFESLNSGFTSVIMVYDKDSGQYVEGERLYGEKNRIWCDIENTPTDLQYAFISIEDERFEKHNGVDWKRTFGAVFSFITGSDDYGGSTITQQLIKNLTGDDEVRPDRKIKEIMRALKLERQYTKDEILEMYMNTIFLGNKLYGVQSASQAYFGKDVIELDLAQCAALAGITNNPSLYNPWRRPEKVKERQEIILKKMKELGHITEEQYNAATAEELIFMAQGEYGSTSQVLSWYNEQIRDDLVNELMEQKGYSYDIASRMVLNGGLQIYSCEDTYIQDVLETEFVNDSNFPSDAQCAMVITDPHTGEVKGLIGGRGEKTINRGWNNASQALRQPGSSIKPIAVYGPALDQGLINYATYIVDSPYKTTPKAWPKNAYTGYYGSMSIERAIMISCNTVAVKVLMDKLTPEKSIEFLRNNLGITSIYDSIVRNGNTYSDNGPALALGGLTDGVSVLEMAGAYDVFANDGVYIKPHTFTKVLKHDGSVLLEMDETGKQAVKPSTAYIMGKWLNKVINGGRGATGAGAQLSRGMPTYGKTGTTTDSKDLWFVGYTPYYVGSVWYGYEQPKVMSSRITGQNSTIKIWKTVMEQVHEGLEVKDFEQPADVIKSSYAGGTGYFTKDNMKQSGKVGSGTGAATSVAPSASDFPTEEEPEEEGTNDGIIRPDTSAGTSFAPSGGLSPGIDSGTDGGSGGGTVTEPSTSVQPSTAPLPSVQPSTAPVDPGSQEYFPVG